MPHRQTLLELQESAIHLIALDLVIQHARNTQLDELLDDS